MSAVVDEKNAAALAQTITNMQNEYGDRIRAMEVITRMLVQRMGDLQHRVNVLIQTTSSRRPTERDNGDEH